VSPAGLASTFASIPTTALYGARLAAALAMVDAATEDIETNPDGEPSADALAYLHRAVIINRELRRREVVALAADHLRAMPKASAGDTTTGGGDSGPREGNAGSSAAGPSLVALPGGRVDGKSAGAGEREDS